MIYFHFRADHYFWIEGQFPGTYHFFLTCRLCMIFYWWANTLLKNFLTLKVTIKIVEKTCLIFPHGTTKFFLSILSCVGIFISLPGGITHLSYTVTLMRFVISILQKMLWINCSPTMVDCGPSIKPHCASNRGTVHRIEAPSVNFFFFSQRPTQCYGREANGKQTILRGWTWFLCATTKARKSTKKVSTIVRREHSLYWPGNKIMVRDLLGGTWQYKWATKHHCIIMYM